MTSREMEILDLIRNNPLISQKELASRLGIERSSVAVHIANLSRKGHIKGKGYIVGSAEPVLVIGACNMDISGRATSLVAGESNPGQVLMTPGGVGRNIAEALCRLKIPVALLSALGTDAHGHSILESCRNLGIDTASVKIVTELPTSVYLELVGADGDMALAVNDMALTKTIDIEHVARNRNRIRNASLVVVEANLEPATLKAIADCGQDRLFADPVSLSKARRLAPILDRLYGLKPNRAEAEILSGVSIRDQTDALSAVRVLHDQGVGTIALTLGGEGVLASDGKDVFLARIVPKYAAQVVNTTGSGDVFLAAWSAGIHDGKSFRDSILQAVAAAALNSGSAATIREDLSPDLIAQRGKEVEVHELKL